MYAEATRVSSVAFGNRSPASCSMVNLSNGLFALNDSNHVIAIRRDVDRVVAVVAGGVGVADEVEPPHRHALAEVRRGEQPVHHFLVRVRRLIFHERANFLRRRRQPGEVERQPADERDAIRFLRRIHTLLLQSVQDEGVDRVADFEFRISDIRYCRPRELGERPVLRVLRAFGDPLFQEVGLSRRERRLLRGRRHSKIGVGGADALDEFALGRFARHDRAGLHGLIANVEPELRLARLRVRPVALKTLARQNRPHVLVEVDRRSGKGRMTGTESACDGKQGSHGGIECVQAGVLGESGSIQRTGCGKR